MLFILVAAASAAWWVWVRPQPQTLDVFFVGPADGAATVVPVQRTVTGWRTEVRLRQAIDALLAGPTPQERARGLGTEIPPGVRLRSVSVADGVATVDLTEAIALGGGSSSMQGRLWQIVYTATAVPGVRQVRLFIEGEARAGLGGEGVLIDRPIGRPPAFPRF